MEKRVQKWHNEDGTVAKFAKKNSLLHHWTLLYNEYVSKAQEQESRGKIL